MSIQELDKKQSEILQILKELIIPEFDGYRIDKLLFNISGEAIQSNWKMTLKKFLRVVIINNIKIEISESHNHLPLVITYDYHRNDHTAYWNSMKGIIEHYDEIQIDEGQKENRKIRKISEIIGVISSYLRIMKSMKAVKNRVQRSYLSSNLADLLCYKNRLDKISLLNQCAFIFFDGNRVENLTVQNLRNRGITVATMQHGQPVFHGKDCDRINQTMILNFSSDYIIVTGEFSKKQFMLGGVPEEQIFVGGSLREVRSIQEFSGNDFALFLDCPTNQNAAQNNRELIDCAEKISEILHSKYIIKCHPQDDPINYISFHLNNGSFLPKENRISDALVNKNFALLHASGVYLDVLANGTKAFCYINEIDFPLVEESLDSFSSVEELIKKYKAWSSYTNLHKIEYMNYLIQYYLYPEGIENRYRNFAVELSTGKKPVGVN